jgi:hypothetical protein
MRRVFAVSLVVLAFAATGRPTAAEIVPMGAPVDVAETDLYSFESRPRICADPSGAFTVVWSSADVRIMARRFSRDGEPLAPPFQFLDRMLEANDPPEIACLPSGAFVAVWSRATPDYSDFPLMARVFNGDGVALSQEMRIDQHGYVNHRQRIACNGSGCVVVWSREVRETDFDAILARRLGLDGKPQGDEILVASSSHDDAYPDVAIAPDGSFFVSFAFKTNALVGIQPYGADGSTAGPAITIRPTDEWSFGSTFNSIARSPEGSLLVAWRESYDGLDEVMYHSVVLPDGRLAVDRQPVDPGRQSGDISAPLVVPDAGGGFVMVWGDRNEQRLFGRQLTAQGTPRGPDHGVAEPTSFLSAEPTEFALASRFDGTLAVAWTEQVPYAFAENRVTLFRTSQPAPPAGDWLASPQVAGYGFKVRFSTPSGSLAGTREPGCIPETLCVSGALPGRSEVFARMVGPKPNGFLWPTLVKFSTSTVEVWVRQDATGETRHYVLDGARPGFDELPGLFDRTGFEPVGAALVAGLFGTDPAVLAAGTAVPPPAVGTVFTSEHFPDFRFRVRISVGGQAQEVRQESGCIEETLCLSGAIPGRSEIFLRMVGPKPNGRLWPTIVKFTTSTVEVWVEQISTATTKYYVIEGAALGKDDLTGLFDRQGFEP